MLVGTQLAVRASIRHLFISFQKGNIEDREIFENKIEETITQLRLKSASEGEWVIGASPYRIEDYSDEDWSSNWDLLKVKI